MAATLAELEVRLVALEEEVARLREEIEGDGTREAIRRGGEQVAREAFEALRKKLNIPPA